MILNNVASVSQSTKAGFMGNGTRMFQQNKTDENKYSEMQGEKAKRISNMKRMISGANKQQNGTKNIIDSTREYGNQIRSSRETQKNTASSLKKLKYNFKNISSQIRRSKTSVNAKQVASKARREVVALKSKLQTGKYDKEELQAAIEHAKSMERAAKKKARHLEEEELIKVTDREGNPISVSDFEEQLENKMEEAREAYEAEMDAAVEEALSEMSEEQIAAIEEAIAESMDEVQQMMEQSMEESMEEVTEDMYDLLAESMEDMMEETLGDLAESMMVMTDYEMNEEEFKTFRLKHRASEDKVMLEADGKYLKAIFDMYSRRMGGGDAIQGMNGGSSATSDISAGLVNSGDIAASIPNIVDISL